MPPVDHAAVAAECTLALQAQPRFPRALLRRARALEALGRFGEALEDVQALLAEDPSHRDAIELERRLRAGGPSRSRPSAAALGASAVRGAPVGGLGPCLPARPIPKKTSPPPPQARHEEAKPEKPLPVVSGNTQLGPNPPLVESPVKDIAVGKNSSELNGLCRRRRALKLVYDHDIRLSEMPENCKFKELREIVSKRFPSSKSVLVKYKDSDGDLVTITSTAELNLATKSLSSTETLRLHVVEVDPEQEPPLFEELDQQEDQQQDREEEQGQEQGQDQKQDQQKDQSQDKKQRQEEKQESNEVEMDDWLFEFAQLFRTQVGIDPDAHLDLHELGMELCSEALEETVTSEEAQELFDMAAAKFQEVAALAFFNWGNVHMCAARKRIPLDNAADKEKVNAQLQSAYDWVLQRYSLAGEKYEEALKVKPDFYEGLLALGQQHFETAKLQWSFTLAQKTNLSTWDSTKTIELFNLAEEKMREASAMWEKVEEQRAQAGLNCKRKSKKSTEALTCDRELTPEESAEQAAVMRSQIHLFWGNMLFERSQVEFKLKQGDWKGNLDAAVERFKLAGASEEDISVVLKNHFSNVKEGENGETLTFVDDEHKKLT